MNERLRWGVLGTATIARNAVVPALRAAQGCEVVAVASRDVDKARAFAADTGIPTVLDNYEALLADDNIDAVYIPLPNRLHGDWSVRAAEAGKAVLCEKPLACNADESQRIVDACTRLGAPLMEAFMYRFHPQHARVAEIISSGAIGEVIEVRAHLSCNIMAPPDPANVRFARDLGGGALLDMGCYSVGICRMVFREEPTGVRAWSHTDERFNVDVAGAAILEFDYGCVGLASWSFKGDAQGQYTVIGSEGSIEVPRAILPGSGGRLPQAIVIRVSPTGQREEELLEPVDQYQRMVERFADAVMNGLPVPLPNEDSISNMRALDAIATAARA